MIRRSGAILGWSGVLVLTVGPILLLLIQAFALRWFYPAVLPAEWSSALLLRRLSEQQTRTALGLSLWIAVLVSGFALLIGYPAARVLELQQWRGKQAIYLLLFLPTVVPASTLGMGLNIGLLRLGLAGTTAGVVLAHLIPVLPYTVFTLGGVFANYNQTYEHQALVLGANRWQIGWQITLPLIFPGLVVATLLAFLISWSQYVLTFLIGGGQVQTLPILLFATLSGGDPAASAVIALIFVAPLLLIIAGASRYLAVEQVAGAGARL